MPSRLRLRPAFRPIRRGGGTVQLGRAAESGGILLAGLTPSEVALLERLDGSLTEPDLYALAAGWGVPRRRAAELLHLLREHRVLLDLPPAEADPGGGVPRRRHVVVAGTGPLCDTIAAVLRAGGVGRVDAGAWAADLAEAELREAEGRGAEARGAEARGAEGRGAEARGAEVRGAEVRGAEVRETRFAGAARPHLVVPVSAGRVDARVGRPWRRLGVPVLPVVTDGVRVVVGPLVGNDPAAPCLRCVELARADPAVVWPDLGDEPWAGDPLDAALGSVAAGVVAMVAHAVLTGEPVPPGVSVEVGLTWPRLDHRRWERHPGCSAHTDAARGAWGETGLGGVGTSHG